MTLTVYSIDGVTPVVDPTAYVHPTAVLIGDVIVGPGCYVGPTACLRGDFGRAFCVGSNGMPDSKNVAQKSTHTEIFQKSRSIQHCHPLCHLLYRYRKEKLSEALAAA